MALNYLTKIMQNLNFTQLINSYRFSFDVELVLLFKKKNIKIRELPVNWIHKSGSKLIFFTIYH